MPLIPIEQDMLSELVFHEIDPSVGYARRVVNISDNETTIPMGTVVFRTKASGQLDQGAPFAVAETDDLVATNEFAVVFGDAYGCKGVFTTGAAADAPHKAVAYVRGEVQLKDRLLMAALEIEDRDSAEYKALKALLEAQGIIIERTLGA